MFRKAIPIAGSLLIEMACQSQMPLAILYIFYGYLYYVKNFNIDIEAHLYQFI